jgi:hypothetical protein
MRSALIALAAASLVLTASAQKTWYVDVNGTPPGTGTVADPFVGIQQAIAAPAVVDGDTILVAPGVYAEKLNYLGKTVQVKSTAGPLQTRIDPDPGPGWVVVELASDHSGINKGSLEGFTVSGSKSGTAYGVIGGNDRVVECIITGFGTAVITKYDLWLDRCTVVGNDVGLVPWGPLFFAYFRDSILAYNDVDIQLNYSIAGSTFDYCLIEEGVWWGTPPTNLTGDPGLWNPDQGDFFLGPLSPCIDSGDPLAPPDPDGSPRDMGALTYDAAYVPPTVVYCTAKVNSDGCTVDIGSSGGVSASASAPTPFLVRADGVLENTPGLLFYGFGRRAVPFLGGWHCVEPPTPRVGGQNSGIGGGACTGRFAFDFNGWVQSGADPMLVPGTMVDAQWWYRDLLDPQAFFSSTSDAIEFAVAP